MALSRAQILAHRDDRSYADVPVPEWGEDASIRIRGLTSGERYRFFKTQRDNPEIDPNALVVLLSAVDDDGAQLFPSVQDVDAVSELQVAIVERVAEKALELAGLGDDAAADAEKNSGTTPSSSSDSSSPETSDAPSPSSTSD